MKKMKYPKNLLEIFLEFSNLTNLDKITHVEINLLGSTNLIYWNGSFVKLEGNIIRLKELEKNSELIFLDENLKLKNFLEKVSLFNTEGNLVQVPMDIIAWSDSHVILINGMNLTSISYSCLSVKPGW
jgi:hypothetical protein